MTLSTLRLDRAIAWLRKLFSAKPKTPASLYQVRSVLIGIRQQAARDHAKRSHLDRAIAVLTTECLRAEQGRGA